MPGEQVCGCGKKYMVLSSANDRGMCNMCWFNANTYVGGDTKD